jgi:hypothetical protein
MAPVTVPDRSIGARFPFVFIQCIMVALVIIFPGMVMHYKGVGTGIDPKDVKIEISCRIAMPPLDFGPPKIQ